MRRSLTVPAAVLASARRRCARGCLPGRSCAAARWPTTPPTTSSTSRPIRRSTTRDALHEQAQARHDGLRRLAARHADGVVWGTYRCETWGPHEASLHAESRAVDWHLDVGNAADRHGARRLIELFLAPDAAGTPHALARRMGVEEIIWDCSYWGAGMQDFIPYRACENKHGEVRKHVDPTTAHRNHIHFGLSKAGAMRRTSYWQHA